MKMFTRWCVSPEGRTPVSIKPSRVDCLECFSEAFKAATGESFPAATKVIMQGGQEYIVQGSVSEVASILNGEKQ